MTLQTAILSGEKLDQTYLTETKSQGNLLQNPTINQQLKNRMLSDSAQKLKIFKPSSATGARDALNSKEGKMMYKNPFGYSKYLALDAKH